MLRATAIANALAGAGEAIAVARSIKGGAT
jgi:hypothetical protein